jgi:hypothetical protein
LDRFRNEPGPRQQRQLRRDTVIQISNTSNNMVHAHCFYVNAQLIGGQPCGRSPISRSGSPPAADALGRQPGPFGESGDERGIDGSGLDPAPFRRFRRDSKAS